MLEIRVGRQVQLILYWTGIDPSLINPLKTKRICFI
jgi:hypothetical protein